MRRYARITAVSVKSGSKLAERYGDSIRRYASITAVSVKSGSKLAGKKYWHILPAGMLESQLSWSSLVQDRLGSIGILPAGMLESQRSQSHLAGKYWHTTSRYAI